MNKADKLLTLLFLVLLSGFLQPGLAITAEEHLKNAKSFFIKQNLQKSFKECNQAIQKNPSYAEAYLIRGWLFMRLGKPQKALQEFDRCSSLDKKNVSALKSKNILYRLLKDYVNSDKCIEIALKLNPKDPESYYLKGVCEILDGRHSVALKAFNRAIEYGPDHPKLYSMYYWRGRTYQMIGKDKEAVHDLSKAFELCNKQINSKPVITDEYALSSLFFNSALKEGASERSFGQLERATSYLNLGEYAKAIKDLTDVLKLNPKENLLLEERGVAHLLNGDYNAALKDLNKALVSGSHSTDLFLEIATANFCLGKYKQVPSVMDTWFSRQGYTEDKSPYAIFIHYTSLIRSKQFKKAHLFLAKVKPKIKKNSDWHYTCFYVLKKSRCCKGLLSFGPRPEDKKYGQAHFMAAVFYSLTRKHKQAKDQFELVMKSKNKHQLEIAVAKAELAKSK